MKYLTLLIVFAAVSFAGAAPVRESGLSIHLLPDRVAKIEGGKGGFTVTDPKDPKNSKTCPEVASLVEYILKQPEGRRDNGVWVVYTNPSSYSQEEKGRLADLISKLQAQKIPIFTCRASELTSGGWKEAGRIP